MRGGDDDGVKKKKKKKNLKKLKLPLCSCPFLSDLAMITDFFLVLIINDVK